MPKQPTKPHTRTECPNCHGTQFQGPFTRGHFDGDQFVVDETVYQCRTCHAEHAGAGALHVVPLMIEGTEGIGLIRIKTGE